QAVETGKVEMQIDVASVNTANEDRDSHLKAPDFFDVANHPSITFVSRKVVKGEGDEFQIVGDMTMRGVTREVTFDCEFRGSVEFMGTTKAGFSASAVIDRQDFGVSFSKALETGGLVVGNEVELNLEIEINKVG
ncbi:MAG: YceI family protein, partial [bacterium]|nr:YceI family protein [bacterium]